MSFDALAANMEGPYEVSFDCQYVIEHTANQMPISGVIVSGIYYVSADIIAQLTGCRWWVEESDVFFVPDRIYHRYCLSLSDGKLREENLYIADRSWDIPIYENGYGEMLVALEPMLEAMNARVAYDATEKIPLSVYLPYTVLDGRYDLKGNELLFQWTEADVENEDEKSNVILSAFNALYLDYSDHFIIDPLFSWWNDDILTVTEEQYFDAFTEILTCLSDENSALEDDTLYETYTLQNDVFGLTSDMYELMGLNLEEIKALGKYAETAQYGQILIEHVDLYMTYKSVNENQRKMIETVFVNPPDNTVPGSKEFKPVRNAASHVQALIGGNVVSGATAICDAIAELSSKVVDGAVSAVTPVLTIVDGTATLLKILPDTSKLTDINAAAVRAGHCDVLVGSACDYFQYFNQMIKSVDTPDEAMLDNIKQSMLFIIRGTIATRELLLDCNALELTDANAMRQKNSELINLLTKIETSTIQMAPERLSGEYRIIREDQSQEYNVINDSEGGFVLANPYPEGYQMNEIALDNLFSGHFANMSAPMGLEFGCTYDANKRFALKASYDMEDPANGAYYLMIADVLGNVYEMIPISKYPREATGWIKDDVFYCSDGRSAYIMKQGGNITDNFFEKDIFLLDVVNDSNGIMFFTANTIFDSPYDSEDSSTDTKYEIWDDSGKVIIAFYQNELVSKYGIDSWLSTGSFHLENLGNGIYHVSNRYEGNESSSAQYIFIDVNRKKAFAIPVNADAEYEDIESDGNHILIHHSRTHSATVFDIATEEYVYIENISEAFGLGEGRFFTDICCYDVQGNIIFENEDINLEDKIVRAGAYHDGQALIIIDGGKYYQSSDHEYDIRFIDESGTNVNIVTSLKSSSLFYSFIQEFDTYCIFERGGAGGFLSEGTFQAQSLYGASNADCYYGVIDNGNKLILRYGHVDNDYSDEISAVKMFGYELFAIN